ncbi:MAG: hypothetical protein Ct9H300mP7_4240 [Verrucomicrobiota bacterium]|nr:MAG: hypothetical protein Ct9H300mP7_4240 [Verrucomicrobiota bacterium]
MEERYYYFDSLTDEIALAHAAYVKRKRANGVMDFDDLLTQWLRLLRENSEARSRSRRGSNSSSWMNTRTQPGTVRAYRPAGGRHHNIMAVGDDSQSIYSWRGANSATCSSSPTGTTARRCSRSRQTTEHT